MPSCSAYGCKAKCDKSAVPPLTLHRLPYDQSEREKWIKAMKRESWKPCMRTFLCSKHFKEEDFDRSPFYTKLKPGAVPSIFESYPPPNYQSRVTKVRIHEDDDKSGSDDQSTSDTYVIQPNTSRCSPTLQPPEKRQRMTFDIVRKSNPQPRNEDEFSVMGKHIANKLRKVPPESLPVVEKLITDVIFEAQCGNVSQTSRIAFYDMMNSNLRNLQQANQASKVTQENDTAVKTENQSSMSPNIVFLLPQSDVAKTLPLNVQVVQAKAEVQNRNAEHPPQTTDQQANHKMKTN